MKTCNPGEAIREIAKAYDRDMSYLIATYQMLAPVSQSVTSWDEQASLYAQFAAMQEVCQHEAR